MSYPGGKGASGAAQKIISWMPPHSGYAELFAGAATIFKTKRPAKWNLALDIDADVVKKIHPVDGLGRTEFQTWIEYGNEFQVGRFCALEWLEQRAGWYKDLLIYLDPPYLPSTLHQRNGRGVQKYTHKFSAECHEKLLSLIVKLKCYVMISGYNSSMYNRELAPPAWTKKTFMAQTRNGMREECVWMNFNPDAIAERHDYRFIGETFRERERIKKMQSRWLNKFKALAPIERNAMLELLQKEDHGNHRNQNDERKY